jgi:DNA-binding response OmpR family regulator
MSQRVLLVEDSTVQALQLRRYLEQHGLSVEVVGLGRAALEIARAQPPAVVVLDVELPDVNGYEICRSLKGDPSTSHIPVVMPTTRDTHRDAIDGLIHGAVDFIAKDAFAPANLVVSLRSLGVLPADDMLE